MPWGKSEEDKQREAEERQRQVAAAQAEQQEKERARQEAAYWASPVGQAIKAKERGDRFFQTTIEASQLQGNSSFGASTSTTQRTPASDILSGIEDAGWRLEHVGYVFIETGTSSTDRVFLSGEMTAISGRVEGIYLFRSTATG